MLRARERDLAGVGAAKKALLEEQLREARAELEGGRETFCALKDDFHFNLRLLQVCGMRVWGFRCRVQGEGFRVQSLGLGYTV